MRAAALHMDRFRAAIDAEVNRRLGRAEPSPHARSEIVRRFRTFCRLASTDLQAARPSIDGLGGNSCAALERALNLAVDAACACRPPAEVEEALRALQLRFCAGIRRIMQPSEIDERQQKRRRRKTPNAGKRVRAAIDRITDGYLALCLDTGKIFDLNPAAEAILGIDAAQLLQKELAELIGERSKELFHDLEARLDAGEDSAPTEITFSRPNGEEVTVEVSVANHTIAGKRLAILVARERTELEPKLATPRARRSRSGFSRLRHLRLS